MLPLYVPGLGGTLTLVSTSSSLQSELATVGYTAGCLGDCTAVHWPGVVRIHSRDYWRSISQQIAYLGSGQRSNGGDRMQSRSDRKL